MSNPPAPEPLAPEPSDASDDLAAIPAFLRQRASALPAFAPPEPSELPPSSEARDAAATPALDPARLPVALPSRRQFTTAAGLLVVAWIVVTLGHQVGDAAAASGRAELLRGSNDAQRAEVAALQGEVSRIADPRFVDQQARAYGLGTPGEIPFALAAGAPSLPPDAPGSASVRLGAVPASRSPLDSWLDVLFGEAP